MLRKAGWWTVVASLVLLVPPGAEAGPRNARKRPFVLRAHVAELDPAARHRRSTRRRFAGYETHTIEFDVYRRGRAGIERPTQVKLYLPNGDLYSAIDVSEFTDETVPKRRRPRATARLPVSGTAITRYGLYGKWRADVCWQTGAQTSCKRGLTFVIR